MRAIESKVGMKNEQEIISGIKYYSSNVFPIIINYFSQFIMKLILKESIF